MTWSTGSQWHRCDPHLHCPGTLFNSEFRGRWDEYFSAIERSDPPVISLGITDYCVLDGYRSFLKERTRERLRAPGVKLVFPNIEFRMTVETERKKGINLHLIFSPDDPQHDQRIESILERFTFDYQSSQYSCNRRDLIRLGRSFDPKQTDDHGALVTGAQQFKLSLDQLRTQFNKEQWLRDNCLVAISANAGDGTAGLAKDSQFAALRHELEAFAHIIFSAQPSVRAYFLGREAKCPPDKIEAIYGRFKPCLHGSDAHSLDKVLKPDDGKLCWIRAEPTFSGLRQILLEPADRVWIGAEPPVGPSKSDVIAKLCVESAPWLQHGEIALNSGLVAVIGPKGSGKTALADMIACCAGADIAGDASFLCKAREHLGTAKSWLQWAGGDRSDPVNLVDTGDAMGAPRVRYLSQKFVERLCGSGGSNDELAAEVESVVFQALPEEERLGTQSFAELRDARLGHVAESRRMHIERIATLGQAIVEEDEKIAQLPDAKKKRDSLKEDVKKLEAHIKILVPSGKSTVGDTIARLQASYDDRVSRIQKAGAKMAALDALESRFMQIKKRAIQDFDILKAQQRLTDVSNEEWAQLRPLDQAEADKRIIAAVRHRSSEEVRLLRTPASRVDADPGSWALDSLKQELDKLTKQQGAEQLRTTQYKVTSEKLAQARRDVDAAESRIKDYEGAAARRKAAAKARKEEYALVFDTFDAEAAVLRELYAPLGTFLAAASGTSRQIGLAVKRRVDVADWAMRGESLLDLRKKGAFQRRGALQEEADKSLRSAWESKASEGVAEAMDTFLGACAKELVDAKAPNATLAGIAEWLFDVSHVQVSYAITFQGVELPKLSPGSRGVVLLMLYLAVDQWDSRPLIVDQPEENLDPQSVFDELVPFFRMAKGRRQVILVTHNANLVVNADADQVIVATAERQAEAGLPVISYRSGALEDADIRDAACKILEGGRRAFLERESRYGLRSGVRAQPSVEA